ncbi:XRE family transcriptional regulator [Nonomuraea longispora]|uniref:XRE family transcriptional regulator n=1 Tax=Nonomuraea longispora TaxID=1848320 RepID=A0A4R4N5U8_9ACTN|nr:helix-turn-helix transcriptional regulator [Nonomuraea longispora]TDC01672.1 XRE family transcriptional regulator [Nonomuraea longispora]
MVGRGSAPYTGQRDRPCGFADFLRRRRDLLRPADVDLPDGVRRRAPGLRHDEVAALAGMSSDYYARLEQCRGANPSAAIVACLARALRCDLDERDHLYRLAGLAPPARRAGRRIRPGLTKLAERLTDVPVRICTDLHEMLWQNALADIVLGRHAASIAWRWFTEPAIRAKFPEEDWPRHSRSHVNDLRATYSRRASEAGVVEMAHGLLERSQEFRELWERHEAAVRRFDRKRFLHPELGTLRLTCEVLLTPEEDLKMPAFFPTEGTDAQEKLDLLRVTGSQSFQTTA